MKCEKYRNRYQSTECVHGEPHNRCAWRNHDKCIMCIPKPKPKLVRIKAWAYIGATTKKICVSTTEPLCANVPCIAIIKIKDIKKLKGEK